VASDSAPLSRAASRALRITDTAVTRDPARTEDPCSTTPGDENKVWSIGHLLKREAEKTGNTPSNYVTSWMNSWIAGNSSLNGQTVPPLLGPSVRDTWQKFAGGSTAYPLHKAPFWLLAIVSRLDLRKHRPAGEPLGGEVRFVFGFLGAAANNPPCPTLQSDAVSTVIFEYSANKSNENDVRDFARRWLALTDTIESEYRNRLASLTEEVINNGKLLRIRTNEGSTSDKVGGTVAGWDMGEFEPHPTTKLMQRSTIKQSPTEALAGGTSEAQPMSEWIWANRAALSANAFEREVAEVGEHAVVRPPIGSYWVPNQFPSPNNTTWFRGSINTLKGGDFWSGSPGPTGVTTETLWDWVDARFRFSIGTCKGCHGGETDTPFLHIGPRNPGEPAILSPFLRGRVTVADPEWGSGLVRNFDEMLRREVDLRVLVDQRPVQLPVFGNYYQIRFYSSRKCLDSEFNTTADGAPSKLYTCHGEANQRLALVPAPGQPEGVYNLKYKHSGKCLEPKDGSVSISAPIVQTTCDPTRASQRVTLETRTGTTPNSRILKFKHSLRCLLPGNNAVDGTAVIQAPCPAPSDFAKGFHLVE
jgi:hypothetical protein